MNETCIFCKIINKEIKAEIIFEDEKLIAFRDINPQAPVHIIIIPKKHIVNAASLEFQHTELIGSMVLLSKSL
ncbi:MAG: HIT domain-containing protein, partial [Elusimicrobiota bacterium]